MVVAKMGFHKCSSASKNDPAAHKAQALTKFRSTTYAEEDDDGFT